ncbi:MAG: UDP-N-acetylglucosamine 2-epimerase (non-hydrolyzing) [Candidatus Pacebacteria bacterium]|nr:UDP-N-acetylglucosamine 2-epimerase (non-hydrolyzing) [Candidatus Paceibacterota bacterium]
MKIMTILGTRPEIIRLSRIIPKLDDHADHVLVHTGQNYDYRLNEMFFEQLGVRQPDRFLNVKADSFGGQIGGIIEGSDRVMRQEAPDRLLILGDTNSGLSAIVAKRLGIPVYHMEAGNRCYDDRVPEEVNRRVIDHSSDVLMPYTERSRQNLVREGIPAERTIVTGNPILEVIEHFNARVEESNILNELSITVGSYLLVTLHRAENVDIESRLRAFATAFEQLQAHHGIPVIISTHPRTKAKMEAFGVGEDNPEVRYLKPFGLFDFIALEKNAKCVLSDSGTVQEECCILRVPNVTLRDVTERPETIECGSNVLAGADPETVRRLVDLVVNRECNWTPPPEYLARDVSETVLNIALGHRGGDV